MSLYLDHFGLTEPPFRITPHTDFFFAGADRGAVLDALCYALEHEEGIIQVSGEVGSGKTMLCRMLLQRLEARGRGGDTVYLANPSLSREEILAAIAADLGLELPDRSPHGTTRALQQALLERYAQGRRVVLLIDEAQAMPGPALEEVRLLSNLETPREKLLQIVLFAQPELDTRLADPALRPLRERITQHFQLQPLARPDVAAYLEFRLRAAGYRGPNPFTPAAVGRIARSSAGLTRRINILADKALLAAFCANQHQVDQDQAAAAIKDARFQPIAPSAARWLRPLALAAGGLGLLAFLTLALPGIPWPERPAAQNQAVARETRAAPTPPVAPLQAAAPEQVEGDTLPPRTAARLADFQNWIGRADPSHFTLQLLVTDAGSAADVERLLGRLPAQLADGELRVYRSGPPGRERLGVIYGDYPDRQAAGAALARLPGSIRASGPYPRPIAQLR